MWDWLYLGYTLNSLKGKKKKGRWHNLGSKRVQQGMALNKGEEHQKELLSRGLWLRYRVVLCFSVLEERADGCLCRRRIETILTMICAKICGEYFGFCTSGKIRKRITLTGDMFVSFLAVLVVISWDFQKACRKDKKDPREIAGLY